jgi:carbamoyl-phosphate synthase small subunit
MTNTADLPAVLLLEDGTVFQGKSFGKSGVSTGEICFTTGMTGYQEVFTDPSFYGQLLVTTNAHIGNYGTKALETESSKMQISGLICKNFTSEYSRELADGNIKEYFEGESVRVISDVDTRALVRHIRDKGAMNAIIATDEYAKDLVELKKRLANVPSMEGLELASEVSTTFPYEMGEGNTGYRIAVIDYGTKMNILRCFTERNCRLKIYGAKSSLKELQQFEPDGYFISNGPGDPGAMDYAVDIIKEIIKLGKPIFGICLGHQLLARAFDIPTYKMHNGHRGINHPVKNVVTNKCEITTQNHGFAVDRKSIDSRKDEIMITHINLNDDSIEGLRHRSKPAMSVQYHPEASPGPHDSRYLFDDFIKMIEQNKL